MAGSAREWILSGTQYGTVKFCCSVGYSTSLEVSSRDDIQYLIGRRLKLSIGVGGGMVQFSCFFYSQWWTAGQVLESNQVKCTPQDYINELINVN